MEPPLKPIDPFANAVAPMPSPVRAEPALAPPPFFSLIVPVHDGGADFDACLAAVERLAPSPPFEVLVVDDASTDGSGERAAARGRRVLRQSPRRGPAAARNRGAREARGEFLFFLDADCEIDAEALRLAAEVLAADPGLDALFGSYDDSPSARGVVSQFKNLFHHWTHQRGAEEARTFWAGCGAVRRTRFVELGGFDEDRYAEPSIEDIELGYRLVEAGGRIRLAKRVQVKHRKRWTLGTLVRTDVMRRGVPWMELLHERPGRGGELNLGLSERLIVLAGIVAAAGAFAGLLLPVAWLVAVAAMAVLVLSSRGLYALIYRRAGAGAALGALPLHVLYCCCCGAAYLLGTARALGPRARSREAHG